MGRKTMADRYRDHRRAMVLAMEMQCTPNEAKAEMARRAARSTWERTERRLKAKMEPRPAASGEQPWMMRD